MPDHFGMPPYEITRYVGRYTKVLRHCPRIHLLSILPFWRSPQVQKLDSQMSERDPLLQNHDSSQQLHQGKGQKGVGRALGPLEISRSNRYGILAGLWIATFLSVSLCLYLFCVSMISNNFYRLWIVMLLSSLRSVWTNSFFTETLVPTSASNFFILVSWGLKLIVMTSVTIYFFGIQQIERSELAGHIVSDNGLFKLRSSHLQHT